MNPRQFLLRLQAKLQKSIANIDSLLADMEAWNHCRPEERPITLDDHPEFLELAEDRRLFRKQLQAVEYQLSTAEYGPLPTSA